MKRIWWRYTTLSLTRWVIESDGFKRVAVAILATQAFFAAFLLCAFAVESWSLR